MRLPPIQGIVERRLLVNYRVEPEVLSRLLPSPFRPQLLDGWAVAGICLIRMGHLRPRGVPAALGLRSENAAHRVAVEWDTPQGTAAGVYIPRRDTDSSINALVGGRIFPGEHHRARFNVQESRQHLHVAFDSADGVASVAVSVEAANTLGPSRLFGDVDEASRFFQRGSIGYSPTGDDDRFDGLELRTDAWRVEPVAVTDVRSSYFDDPDRFPPGSAALDCALLMRDVPVTWHALGSTNESRSTDPRVLTSSPG